jgi:hypothetical protein
MITYLVTVSEISDCQKTLSSWTLCVIAETWFRTARVLTNEEHYSTYNLYIKKKIPMIRNIEALRARKFKLELVISIAFTVSVALDFEAMKNISFMFCPF